MGIFRPKLGFCAAGLPSCRPTIAGTTTDIDMRVNGPLGLRTMKAAMDELGSELYIECGRGLAR